MAFDHAISFCYPLGATNQGTHDGVWDTDAFSVTFDGTIPRYVGLQTLENTALSWGIIGKSAPILAEITIRKSHPLEGSRQEAILLPSTTLDFFPLCSTWHTPPPLGHRRRIRVFIPVASTPMRRTSHPSGSRPRDVSLLRQTSAPGIVDAPENPRFPAVSKHVQRTDHMAPSRVHLF